MIPGGAGHASAHALHPLAVPSRLLLCCTRLLSSLPTCVGMVFGGLALLGFLVTLMWLLVGCCRRCCQAGQKSQAQEHAGPGLSVQAQFLVAGSPAPPPSQWQPGGQVPTSALDDSCPACGVAPRTSLACREHLPATPGCHQGSPSYASKAPKRWEVYRSCTLRTLHLQAHRGGAHARQRCHCVSLWQLLLLGLTLAAIGVCAWGLGESILSTDSTVSDFW